MLCSRVCCCFHFSSQSDPSASLEEMALCPTPSLLWPALCGIKSFMYLPAFIELESNQSSWTFMPLSPKTRIPKATWKKLHYVSVVWVTESLGLEKSFKIRVQHCPVAHKSRPQVPHLRVLNPSENSCLNAWLGDLLLGLALEADWGRIPGLDAVLGCQERAGWADVSAWKGTGK